MTTTRTEVSRATARRQSTRAQIPRPRFRVAPFIVHDLCRFIVRSARGGTPHTPSRGSRVHAVAGGADCDYLGHARARRGRRLRVCVYGERKHNFIRVAVVKYLWAVPMRQRFSRRCTSSSSSSTPSTTNVSTLPCTSGISFNCAIITPPQPAAAATSSYPRSRSTAADKAYAHVAAWTACCWLLYIYTYV